VKPPFCLRGVVARPRLTSRIAMTFATFVVVASPIIHVLKVAHISSIPGAWLFYTSLPLTVVVFALASITMGARMTAPLRILWGILGISLVLAMIRTDWMNGTAEDIGGNFLRFLIPLTVIPVMARPSESAWARRMSLQVSLARACLLSSLLAVIFTYWLAQEGFSVYFGLQLSPAILICLAVALVTSSAASSIASMALPVLAGKRGVVVAAVTVLVSACAIRSTRRMSLLLCTLMLCATATLLLVAPQGILPALHQRIGGTLQSLQVAIGATEVDEAMISLNVATQGRADEVTAAVETLDSGGPSAWILGCGLGATIVTANGEATDSTVHFSPVALTLLCGAPLAAAVFIFVALLIVHTLIRSADGACRGTQVLALVAAGEFVFSFSAFTFLQSPTLWMCLAAAAGRQARPSATAAEQEVRHDRR
jgi:hypothetical protein